MKTRPPTFSAALTHDLLQRIYAQHNVQFTASPLKEPRRPKEVVDSIDQKTSGTAITTVTAEDIEPDQVARFFAMTRGGDTDKANPSEAAPHSVVPLSSMILAARFAACFESRSQLTAFAAPLALTCMEVPDRAERERTWDDLPSILTHLCQLGEEREWSLTALQTIVLGYRGSTRSDYARAKKDFEDALYSAIELGKSIVVIVPSRNDLPEDVRPLLSQSLTLPHLCQTIITAILQQTHGWTDDISAEVIQRWLPSDQALAKMPITLLQNAFHLHDVLAAARRLNDLAGALTTKRQTDVMTLDKVFLPTSAAAFCYEILADLRAWQTGSVSWSEVPSSACLYGPPGNGKTSLAAALAGSAGIPLITTSYADCQKAGHQGDFLRTLSDKVTEAIMSAPCVFFMDELDSFGIRDKPSRNSDYVVGVVNGLLEHLSKLNDIPGVIILGATNNPHLVDPAILRPGRFDRKIHLGDPDRAGVVRILEIELGSQAEDLGLTDISNRLIGVSGAQVSAVVRDARARARRAMAELQPTHLMSAVDHIAPQRSHALSHRISIHEAGHAVVGHCLGLSPPRHLQLSVTGGAYGYVMPDTMTLTTAQNHLATLMGGRAAEIELLGACSSGADNDLAEATDLALSMRYRWGMQPNALISISRDTLRQANPSEPSSGLVDTDLRDAEEISRHIIRDHTHLVHRIADALLQASELSGEDLRLLLNEATEPGQPGKNCSD